METLHACRQRPCLQVSTKTTSQRYHPVLWCYTLCRGLSLFIMPAIELSPPKRLGRTVVLGYCDISAAGIRVLEGLEPPSESTNGLRETGRESLTFMGEAGPVFEGLPALEAVHFDGGSDEESITLLKINTTLGEDLPVPLALSITDLLDAHRITHRRLIVAAALQSPKRHQIPTVPPSTTIKGASPVIPPDTVCVFSCGSGRLKDGVDSSSVKSLPGLLSGLPALPSAARIADSFLTTLVRLCRLSDLPLSLLVRQGYRSTGAAPDVDGTDEAIKDLGQCLSQVIGLEFDEKRAYSVRRSKGSVGYNVGVVPGYM